MGRTNKAKREKKKLSKKKKAAQVSFDYASAVENIPTVEVTGKKRKKRIKDDAA